MGVSEEHVDTERILATLRSLEERIARIEGHLGLEEPETLPDSATAPAGPLVERDEEELEFELGQSWFARVGILVIALGVVFALTFPYKGISPFVPSLLGYVLAGGIVVLSHLWRFTFTQISNYLRGAALALLYFATLRLYFFGEASTLLHDSFLWCVPLILAAIVILIVALRRKSVYLATMALVAGHITVLILDEAPLVFAGLAVLALLAVVLALRYQWPRLIILGIFFCFLSHLIWAVNNPFLGRVLQVVHGPQITLYALLVYALVFGLGTTFRKGWFTEDYRVIIAGVLNGAGSYGIFLLLTFTTFQESFVASHLAASVTFLAIAVIFWVKEQSRYSTFLYAMLGYMAMGVAILKAFSVPAVFVWLSLQSLLVVATAIWFRSRFIVVANFVLFLAFLLGYWIDASVETGISLVFGVVALISARILNWQQKRLELKTEMMRNAYLASAFVMFPYALYHLVPRDYVSLSWVGIALFYYLMGLLVKRQKYRWMGHLTLLVTVLYILIIGIIQLEPTYRILSFLVLGVVLLVVSIVFTRLRARNIEAKKRGEGGGAENP